MEISKVSTKKLLDDLRGLHQSIYINDCFGIRDLLNYGMIRQELNNRGYDIFEENELVITKRE